MSGVLSKRSAAKCITYFRNGYSFTGYIELSRQKFHTNSSVRSPYRTYNVGMFGCGRIAGVHLKNVLRNRRFDLKWIVENDTERISEVKNKFRIGDSIPFYTPDNTSQLLKDPSLDGVLVISSTNTHTKYICESLNHDKAVFSEKPAGESYDDIQRCYDAAEKSGKPFLTGYTRRFDQTFIDVKKAVSNGDLGKLMAIKTITRDSPKPSYEFLKSADSSGCNILADLGVHDIDMIVWLTDSKRPESIFVNCHVHDDNLKECGEPDSLGALIKYPDGTLITMDIFRESIYGYDIRLEAFGSQGMALSENPRETSTVIDNVTGGKQRRLYNSFPQRFEAAFEAELDHFADCIDGTSTPLITKEESLRVAEITEKGVQSYKERRVVYF